MNSTSTSSHNSFRITMFLVLLLALAGSCGSDDEGPMVVAPDESVFSRSAAVDFGNEQMAADIFSSWEVALDARVAEARLFVATHKNVKPEDAAGIASGNFISFPVTGSTLSISQHLPEGFTDFTGQNIGAGVYYLYLALMYADQTVGNLSNPVLVTLADKPLMTGNYTGTWNDNLYTDFPISARITSDFGGTFFYSGGFTSCCGGASDGTISFRIEEDKTISTFTYTQRLENFLGGECPGIYRGTGRIVITSDVGISVDFEGEDCEGEHTGGKIFLLRQ